MNFFNLLKLILILSFISLGMIAILWHKNVTKEEPPVQVEYKFMNLNL